MTIYNVAKFYNGDDTVRYSVLPYHFKGTMSLYLGFNFKRMRPIMSWYPWYSRYTSLFKFVVHSRLTEKAAERLKNKLEKKYGVLG